MRAVSPQPRPPRLGPGPGVLARGIATPRPLAACVPRDRLALCNELPGHRVDRRRREPPSLRLAAGRTPRKPTAPAGLPLRRAAGPAPGADARPGRRPPRPQGGQPLGRPRARRRGRLAGRLGRGAESGAGRPAALRGRLGPPGRRPGGPPLADAQHRLPFPAGVCRGVSARRCRRLETSLARRCPPRPPPRAAPAAPGGRCCNGPPDRRRNAVCHWFCRARSCATGFASARLEPLTDRHWRSQWHPAPRDGMPTGQAARNDSSSAFWQTIAPFCSRRVRLARCGRPRDRASP